MMRMFYQLAVDGDSCYLRMNTKFIFIMSLVGMLLPSTILLVLYLRPELFFPELEGEVEFLLIPLVFIVLTTPFAGIFMRMECRIDSEGIMLKRSVFKPLMISWENVTNIQKRGVQIGVSFRGDKSSIFPRFFLLPLFVEVSNLIDKHKEAADARTNQRF